MLLLFLIGLAGTVGKYFGKLHPSPSCSPTMPRSPTICATCISQPPALRQSRPVLSRSFLPVGSIRSSSTMVLMLSAKAVTAAGDIRRCGRAGC